MTAPGNPFAMAVMMARDPVLLFPVSLNPFLVFQAIFSTRSLIIDWSGRAAKKEKEKDSGSVETACFVLQVPDSRYCRRNFPQTSTSNIFHAKPRSREA